MADTPSVSGDTTPKLGAPKDKNCPYCGQAFTSSSLGRHLDLYIKDKNPKPPDGLHDVDAIKKLRGGITRRQPRGSIGGRRDASTPVGTPKPSIKTDGMQDIESYPSPPIPKDGYAVDSTMKCRPFQPTWEATGVINNIPAGNGGENTPEPNKRPGMQRNVSKQVIQKAQFDMKQKLADAMDTARAAELALRELVSSWRAAKIQIDTTSMPFDFDPLSLDFPALTLQCLQPPPTLFSSTQHPTSTSWSVQCPGQREFDALRAYFQEEFRSFKITCAAATTAANDEFSYPPSTATFRDGREEVRRAEKSAEHLEAQLAEHLQSAYTVWQSLEPGRQQELWVLELARGVGRKHKEMDKMKQEQHRLKQENSNLKSQVDHLNRLQQPREFKISSPLTIPMDRDLLLNLFEQGVNGGKGVGFNMEDRHVDLGTIVSRSIERWKTVISSTRTNAAGMNAQRSFDQAPKTPAANVTINGPTQPQQRTKLHGAPSSQIQTPRVPTPQPPVQQQQPQQKAQQQQQQQQPSQPMKRLSTSSTNGLTSEQASNATSTTGPPSIEETSDQDADAEMEDDDSFAIMNASPVKQPQPPIQQQATLEVPRTRGPVQNRNPDPRFMMPNGTGSPVGRQSINLSRSMPNMNMAMQNAAMHQADMGMAMQGVRGEPMYLE